MNLADIPRNGTIYRLVLGEYYYTGSTFETIHHRVKEHKGCVKRGGGNRKLYKHITENGGWDAVKVLVLETNILDEATLLRKEQSYINLADPYCLNSVPSVAEVIPKRPSKPRSEERKAYDRTYYEVHKEHLKKKRMDSYNAQKDDPEFREKHRRQGREAQRRAKKILSGED